MKILVWQWGRRGVGSRFAVSLAQALRAQPGKTVSLSIAAGEERGVLTFMRTMMRTARQFRPELAFCAMPGPLDLLILLTLRCLRIRVVIIVHEVDRHRGTFFCIARQLLLCRLADAVAARSHYVAQRLAETLGTRTLIHFTSASVDATASTGSESAAQQRRLLFVSDAQADDGLDLLEAAVALLPADAPVIIHVVTDSVVSGKLNKIRAFPVVVVDNRTALDTELDALLHASDGVVVPFRQDGQSRLVAAAILAGRPIIATCANGLPERLRGIPNAILCYPYPECLAIGMLDWLYRPTATVDDTAAWHSAVAELLDLISAGLAGLPRRPAEQPARWNVPGIMPARAGASRSGHSIESISGHAGSAVIDPDCQTTTPGR